MTDAPGTGQPFDMATARGTFRLLQLAFDRWCEVYANLADIRFGGENSREDVSLRVRGPAVETIMWARALDDWCRGLPESKGPTQPVLAGYEAQRAEVEGLLAGARYATNRSVHQLLALMVPRGVMKFPLNVRDIFGTFAGVRWLTEGHLLPPTSEKQGQQKLREQYIAHLAGNEVGPTLDRLREFFGAVFTAEDA